MLLSGVVAAPESRISELPLLSEEERRQLLVEWNDTAVPIPEATLPELFEQQVERSPEVVALVFEDTSLTYAELNRRANRLAHHLIDQGVGPEDLVALALPRSLEMVTSLLAILKAGAAYLPLDPDYPAERLAFMLADARPRVLITDSATAEGLSAAPEGVMRLLLDDPAAVSACDSACDANPTDAERIRALSPQNPAYVIYTSGSTGTPKSVVITQQNVVSLFVGTAEMSHFGAGDVWTLFLSVAFDFSVWEIWGALVHGGRVVIVPHNVTRSP